MNQRKSSTLLGIILLYSASLTACGEEGNTPDIARRISLSDSTASSLHALGPELWLAGPTRIVHLDSAGQQVAHLDFPGTPEAGAEILGDAAGMLFFRVGPALGALAPGRDSLRVGAPIGKTDALTLDPLGRFAYQSGGHGAITAHEAETLRPVWGWPALGGLSEGIALSPEGDRLYQAVAPKDGQRLLLVRDLQTGRILRQIEVEGEVRRMAMATDGGIYVVESHRGDADVVRYTWAGGTLAEQWRTVLSGIEPASNTQLHTAPSGQLLAVLTPENEEGLHILDAETGVMLGQVAGPARDVAFRSTGEILLLVPGEIHQLETIGQ